MEDVSLTRSDSTRKPCRGTGVYCPAVAVLGGEPAVPCTRNPL